ncbi:MxaD family protein [Haematobacter massiliensis]|uniref:Signal peptide protein n=1 Tax=Haematobacter massiliensis TaxID=195105 RepID=A0A086Y385_9RHOB|nr:SRPBCC family protein [Haematobacter massiliensis]KFI28735.1 signal peptide protein [Haematobacter massiliensis]OWJ69581.1 MxaD family protein [Haematobacter massiliensis]OWJ86830.1 MxaD family protein [Haematobacter massiliensis]QBJ26277.1 SRPBCC family protein [Haematobacter massiliensis]
MRKLVMVLTAGAALVFGAGLAEAHGPSRQKVVQEVTLNATPDEVWAVIGKFDDLSWYPRAKSVETVSGAEVKQDEQRTVTWDNGEQTTEELTKWNPERHTYSYRTVTDNIKALAVTNYSGIIAVKDEGGKAKVQWTGAFYRGFPNNDPPPELNDEAAIATVTAAHQMGLDALVEKFGAAN